MRDSQIERIATTTHTVNRLLCCALGDESQERWKDCPQWQKDSAIQGVKNFIANPDITPEESHKNWMDLKLSQGWKYGTVKDVEGKKHPCIASYKDLPYSQQLKDKLFIECCLFGMECEKDLDKGRFGADCEKDLDKGVYKEEENKAFIPDEV